MEHLVGTKQGYRSILLDKLLQMTLQQQTRTPMVGRKVDATAHLQ